MATIQELKKYQWYQFSTGPDTGMDYISFQTKYINYLKSLCTKNGWEFVRALKSHYCFSAFLKCKNNYIYLSVSDVRFNSNWLNSILYRTANSETDYTGGCNRYIGLDRLEKALKELFERMAA